MVGLPLRYESPQEGGGGLSHRPAGQPAQVAMGGDLDPGPFGEAWGGLPERLAQQALDAGPHGRPAAAPADGQRKRRAQARPGPQVPHERMLPAADPFPRGPPGAPGAARRH